MPTVNEQIAVTFTGDDLPQPGEFKSYEVGRYTFLIENTEPAKLVVVRTQAGGEPPAVPAITADGAVPIYVPVILGLGRSRYTHAARAARSVHNRVINVANFALCNGKQDGRPVQKVDHTRTLADVTCPRCRRWMTLPPSQPKEMR